MPEEFWRIINNVGRRPGGITYHVRRKSEGIIHNVGRKPGGTNTMSEESLEE